MNTMIPGSVINLSIYRNNHLSEVYYRRGDNMPFVQAEVGDKIKVRVSANGWQGRLEAYLSVDGRSAHRNVPASFVADRGLVFTGETIFEGYRLNQAEVSPFTVTYPENSVLAITTGDITNAGVIGLAVFREYQEPVQAMGGYDYGQPKGGLESLTMRGASPVGMTGQGRKTSHVGTTEFRREMPFTPNETIIVQYRPMWWLRQNGIVGSGGSNDPNPFPGRRSTGYDFLG